MARFIRMVRKALSGIGKKSKSDETQPPIRLAFVPELANTPEQDPWKYDGRYKRIKKPVFSGLYGYRESEENRYMYHLFVDFDKHGRIIARAPRDPKFVVIPDGQGIWYACDGESKEANRDDR